MARLAPSPTGAQHLGNARTFLLAYWSARASGAKLILRIEDIDSPRVKSWASRQAIEDLQWLGIEWDGPPVIQTQRSERYQEVLEKLIERDLVYPCVCSRRDIEAAASAPHELSRPAPADPSAPREAQDSVSSRCQPAGPTTPGPYREALPDENATQSFPFDLRSALASETVVYPGTCTPWRRGQSTPEPPDMCWRFRTHDGEMVLHDCVAGTVACDVANSLGDFPVTRKGGEAAYQLAVVIDDADAGVTEVVRGDDLLLSTFRQWQLIEALGLSRPQYAHVPLVVGKDGRRLAKRHGDTRLSTYRQEGLDPAAIVRWAARSAGLIATTGGESDRHPWTSRNAEPLARFHQRMIESFDWSRVSKEKVVAGADWSPEA